MFFIYCALVGPENREPFLGRPLICAASWCIGVRWRRGAATHAPCSNKAGYALKDRSRWYALCTRHFSSCACRMHFAFHSGLASPVVLLGAGCWFRFWALGPFVPAQLPAFFVRLGLWVICWGCFPFAGGADSRLKLVALLSARFSRLFGLCWVLRGRGRGLRGVGL